MASAKDWPIEKLVAEYERRKKLPTIKELCIEVGLSKQGLWHRVQRYYELNPDKRPLEIESSIPDQGKKSA